MECKINFNTQIIRILPSRLRKIFLTVDIDYMKLYEIRLRVNKPVVINYKNEECYINNNGLTEKIEGGYVTTLNEIKEVLQYISNYSMYAYEDEIKQGFITVEGGHRIGLAGKVVMEKDKIKNIRNIAFVNIRISHEIIGCANKILPYIYNDKNIHHTLIVSPPMSGKTTLLRDIIRSISTGESINKSIKVGVVDERSEIGACYNGVPQNDLGLNTDILDCCPKSEGMMMLIRTMSPSVIAVDEIGTRSDVEAIEYVINCGCKLLATVHGTSIEDISSKPMLGKLVKEKIFERYIILDKKSHVGNIKQIFDSMGNILYTGGV